MGSQLQRPCPKTRTHRPTTAPTNPATMPEKTQGFTEDQVEDFKEVFQLFDTKGDGLIQVTQVGDVLRALGQNPTEGDVRSWCSPRTAKEAQMLALHSKPSSLSSRPCLEKRSLTRLTTSLKACAILTRKGTEESLPLNCATC